jgi:cytoskeletal protein CcmA (bactofilin family)
VKITPRGSIIGDVKTPRMTIDDGGQYEGNVDIGVTCSPFSEHI